MAGGGVKGGHVYGSTDDFGYQSIERACTVYDMWATVLISWASITRRSPSVTAAAISA